VTTSALEDGFVST